MIFREARAEDISPIQVVRNSVKENVLSNPALVTDQDVEDFITHRGKGWVCEYENLIVGFAIADLVENNIWALFIDPQYEKRGIGKKLHEIMLEWYFKQGKENVWLSTGPGTRAENFYKAAGWKETGLTSKGEIKFEMSSNDWVLKKQ